MTNISMLVGLAITLQLAANRYEVIAQSQPLNIQKRSGSIGPAGGIAVEHPLQATVYTYRRGTMKLLVPFEITVVPMGTGGLEAERRPQNGYPLSGQIRPQSNVNHVYNSNTQRQYQQAQFGPRYYAPAAYQQQQQYQSAYAPYYNRYSNYNNQRQYYQPAYQMPNRQIDLNRNRWPLYRNTQQRNTTQNATSAIQNWSGNNTAINISSLVNNATHPPNASAPIETTTTTTAPETSPIPTTELPISTTASPTLPEQAAEVPVTDVPPTINQEVPVVENPQTLNQELAADVPQTLNQDALVAEIPPTTNLVAEASFMHPNFIRPDLGFGHPMLPNGMNFGQYQINGN